MNDRRPQWDDDVIRAVTDAIDANFGDPSYQMVWDVIAAVEDWQAQHEIVSAPAALIDAVQRAAIAEAALQRVRELCDNKQREVEESDPLFGPPLTLTVPDVLRALDVPCPTCSGPIRETVGLVCQTCGTDYGDSDD